MFGRAEMNNNSKERQLDLETAAAEAADGSCGGSRLQMNRREPRALAELKGRGEPSFKKGVCSGRQPHATESQYSMPQA